MKSLLSAFIFLFFVFGHAMAIDCEKQLNIAFKLHTSKNSQGLSADKKLLKTIKNHYESAMQQCPDTCQKNPIYCNNLGDVYKRLGDLDNAAKYFKQALNYKADLGDALFELGEIYTAKGLATLLSFSVFRDVHNLLSLKNLSQNFYHSE
ncbi:exported hypothetical protein [Candidatus Magnetomoraceae bacterium gMMP-15]